ncbi:MAG: nucleotidyltransferase domain-containing protein [Planctomycetes bacterium]|nr:nucleotidyltransferase domain-containing protein [Planctomycetota bacterium]
MLRKKSYDSVKVFWLDRDLALDLALDAARRLLADDPNVVKAGIFGSIARKRAVPGSDLDVLIVLERCDVPPLERASAYRPYFEGIGLPLDLVCLTREETARSPLFVRSARDAIWIEREDAAPQP